MGRVRLPWWVPLSALVLVLALLGLAPLASRASAPTLEVEPEPPPSAPAQPVLAPLAPADAAPIDAQRLRERLDPLIADPALGVSGVLVADSATGESLLSRGSTLALIPASGQKIASSAAALAAWGPHHRLATSTQLRGDEVVLVGGGDPTLTTATKVDPSIYPPQSRLQTLVDRTAKALASRGVDDVDLSYDTTLFSGPALSPDWGRDLVSLGVIAPVSALGFAADAPDIPTPGPDTNRADVVAQWFAQRLRATGITVGEVDEATEAVVEDGSDSSDGATVDDAQSPPAQVELARLTSAPLSAIVTSALTDSDNDVAEALFRLAAVGEGLPGTFEGGSQAVRDRLRSWGISTAGITVTDGSGLARSNRITPAALAGLVTQVSVMGAQTPTSEGSGSAGDGSADDALVGVGDSQLRPDDVEGSWLVPALAVAGYTGTLSERFTGLATRDAAGRVTAKTGTLTGVTNLSGLVSTQQGRLVSFSVIANDVTDSIAAREVVDRIAAAIASCGCAADSG